MLRTTARLVLRRLRLYGAYSLTVHGPLKEDGWFRSFEEGRSVDLDGNPIPFITYPAIEFLQRRVRSHWTVFEYGSGASTLWWSRRVAEVVAVEHSKEWYDRVSAKLPENATVLLRELTDDGQYARASLEGGRVYDVVVIDGRDRVNCAKHAVSALKPDGVVLWDNSDRDLYEPGYVQLGSQGFRRLEFIGLTPIANQKSETSIFYRPGNCLGI